MATCLDMKPAIGARVFVRFEQMQIQCTVINVKESWGKPRLLVAPVAGTGEQWVEMGRVTVPQLPPADPSKVEYVRGELDALGQHYSEQAEGLKRFLREA